MMLLTRRVLVEKFSHVRFEPSGFSSNPEIGYAKSIADYIFRWLGLKFLPKDEAETLGLPVKDLEATSLDATQQPRQSDLFSNGEDAPVCPSCGFMMVRTGACYGCPNCGATSGCS